MNKKPNIDQMRLELMNGKKKFLEPSKVKERLYHGTNKNIRSFSHKLIGTQSGNRGFFGRGFYLSGDPDVANSYADTTGGNVMPLHVSLDNPLVIKDKISYKAAHALNHALETDAFKPGMQKEHVKDGLSMTMLDNPDVADMMTDKLIGRGYDGVVYGNNREVVAFHPHQIKSAIGNRGTYDPNDPDITKAKGGSVMGINVASDRKAGRSYADMIVDGHKTLESRNSDTLRPYVGKRVAIVRTGEGKAKAIGEVTIGEPIVANKKQFRNMESHHLVPEGSTFDIKTPTKHMYPLSEPVRYDEERDVGHGIISRKVIHKAKGGTISQDAMQLALAKFLEPSKVKDVLYHGTDKDFPSFNKNTFLTFNPKFAEHFPGGNEPKGQRILPVHVNVKNPWDYKNRSHVRRLTDELRNQGLDPDIELGIHEGDWASVEHPDVINAIKQLGHDSVFVNEIGNRNLLVFKPEQIKSAIGNRGTYDINDPDITKAKGGVVSILRKHGRPVDSDLDAMRKMSNGHRVFVAHEQDEMPTEIHRVSDMHGYTPDQIYTVDPKHFAKGGSTPQMFNIQHKRDDRIPELEMAVQALLSGNITRAQYDKILNKLKPVTPYTAVPRPATDEEALMALHEAKRGKWRGADKWEAGRNVGLRLDIPAYSEHGVWVNSIHDEDNGGVAYGPVSAVENAVFHGGDKKAQDVATGEKSKSPFARIKGMWLPTSDQDAVKQMQKYLKHSDWAQIGYDPRRRDYFYGRQDSRQPVESAEKVLQIGPLVLAKAPKFGSRKNYKLFEGGQVTHAHHLDIEERSL